MFDEGEGGGIDDFDLSQLRSRPITSDGRAGISRDVSEYVNRRARQARPPAQGLRRGGLTRGPAPQEGGRNFAEEGPEEYGPAPRVNTSMILKIIGALAAVAVVAVGMICGQPQQAQEQFAHRRRFQRPV